MTQADGSDDEQMKNEHSSDARAAAESDRAPLEADVQGKLGQKLREAYSEVIDAPVPDRFLDLLAQLDAKSAPSDEGNGA